MSFGKGVMMKLRVDAAEHGLSENYMRRKRVLPFTYEFHSWIKGRVEMESIILPLWSLACSLVVYDDDNTVPPRADHETHLNVPLPKDQLITFQ